MDMQRRRAVCARTIVAVVAGSACLIATVRAFGERSERTSSARTTWSRSAFAEHAGRESTCRDGDRGRLIGYERIASYATADVARAYFEEWIAFYQDLYHFPADLPERFTYGFDSYRVAYCSVDAVLPGESSAEPTVVTGMISIPRKSGPLSTVLYVHGTSVSFYDTVSNPHIVGDLEARGESFEGPPGNSVFASAGFVYIGPDYLGFGGSTVPRHRYFHAPTEASATVDLLLASRRVLADLRVQRTDSLFTFGFSQGGHSALAVHRALEAAGVKVTGTATVGGIFDVEQWFLSALSNTTTVTLPLYMSYILVAYDDIYDIYERTSDVFRQPYARTVDGLFDMQHFFDDVVAALAPTMRALLTRAYYDRVSQNPHTPLRVALRLNAVDRWTPRAPLRIYHSTDDEEAPFADMLVSVDRLRRRGADVTVKTMSGFDHVGSWIQAMPRAVQWFRSLE